MRDDDAVRAIRRGILRRERQDRLREAPDIPDGDDPLAEARDAVRVERIRRNAMDSAGRLHRRRRRASVEELEPAMRDAS